MDKNVRISKEEREKLVRGEQPDFPKYTSQLLNLANQNAQSTRPRVVGKVNDMIDEFEKEYPNGTYEDWVVFYEQEYDGNERIDQGAEKLYLMIQKMKEALETIDKEMAHRYIEELVLYKSYMDNDIVEVCLKKLSSVYNTEYEIAHKQQVDGFISGHPIRIVSLRDATDTESSRKNNYSTVYYTINKSNDSIEIDSHELSESLGVSVTGNGLSKRLDEYAIE